MTLQAVSTYPSATEGMPYDHVEPYPKDQLDRLLAKAKGQLFFKHAAGFLGSLLCDHNFVWDDTCTTAWCNGATIGWNPKLFTWLTGEERVTVLAHELWHTGYLHMTRLGSKRCPDIWNEAADHVINNRLLEDGYIFGEKLMSLRPCINKAYKNMTTEQVYDLLVPPFGQPMPQPQGQPQTDGTGSASGMSDDLRESPNSKEQEAVVGKIIRAIQASKMAREAGVVPGEVELIIDKFLNPILPWEVLLSQFFTDISRDDYSWSRPSRRYETEYLPSMKGENGLEHLIYYLDISGSISDQEILRFNSEVRHIHETYAPKRLTLITFDIKIQDVYEFTDDMPFEKIVVHGRGGTRLDEVQEHIQKHRPSAAVIFSDLYCPPMAQNPGSPVLWIVVSHPTAKVPFGQMIHLTEPTPV